MSKVKILEVNKKLTNYTQEVFDKVVSAQNESQDQLQRAKKLETDLIARIREREERKKLARQEEELKAARELEAAKAAESAKAEPVTKPEVSEKPIQEPIKPAAQEKQEKPKEPEQKPEIKQEAKPEIKPEIKLEKQEKSEKQPEPKAEQTAKTVRTEEKKENKENNEPAQTAGQAEMRRDFKEEKTESQRQTGSRSRDERPARQGDRPQNQRYSDRAPRQQDGERQQRGAYGERRSFDRDGQRDGQRSYGDRQPRQYGDRQPRQFGDSSQRKPYGQNDRRGGFSKDKDDDQGARQHTSAQRKPKPSAPEFAAKENTKQNNHAFDRKKRTDDDNKKKRPAFKDKGIIEDEERFGSKKIRRKDKSQQPVQRIEPIKIEKATITGDTVSIKTFAEKIGKPVPEILKKLLMLGVMSTINSEIDFDTASLVASDFDIELEQKVEQSAEDILVAEDKEDDADELVTRPPVVTIMGHVDHGKTSLLDAIRSTKVTEGEAGGITQHIGAYTVKINGRQITFLDTPGHEAFTAMRARGAQATDIAVLVVAADDGVMPQTIEAINHAKSAGVPIIVAINKIDKEGANIDRIKQNLTEYELVCEDWGGDVIMVPVSAKKKQGIDDLLEMILLQADMLELKANPNRLAKGTIIEARLDKGRGPVATVLVQNGTLKISDTIVAGMAYGRVRAMVNDEGRNVKKAGPSTPVEVIGFSEVPEAGDIIYAVEQDKLSRQVVEERKDKAKAEKLKAMSKVSLDDLFNQIAEGQIKDLNIIVKADVQGSVEAVKQSLEKLSNDEVRVRVVHGGVGTISESDVLLASASNAIIIGFNVRPDNTVTAAAERENVDIRLYRVIYNAIEDVEKAMKGMLAPEFKEQVLGHAEIRQTFKASGVGTIAGCMVKDGKITRNASIRLVRDGIVVHEGTISSLKRFKDDAKEVLSGFECGITVENYNDLKEGDILEAFEMVEVPR